MERALAGPPFIFFLRSTERTSRNEVLNASLASGAELILNAGAPVKDVRVIDPVVTLLPNFAATPAFASPPRVCASASFSAHKTPRTIPSLIAVITRLLFIVGMEGMVVTP